MANVNKIKTPFTAYCGEDTNGWFVVLDSYGHEVGSTDGGFNKEEALLFAAAPELYELATAMMEWIDAVPANTPLPTMPGFDRDWADAVLAKAKMYKDEYHVL